MLHPTWIANEEPIHEIRSPRPQPGSKRGGEELPIGKPALRWRPPQGEVLGFVVDERVCFTERVVPIAGPSVVLWRANHSRPHRIQVPVAHDRQNVASVGTRLNHRRLHALSDNLASPALLLAVVPAREKTVDHLPESAELSLSLVGDDDEMRVGAHEAVGADPNAVVSRILLDEVEEEALGRVEFEHVGGIVAPPGAVVCRTEIDE